MEERLKLVTFFCEINTLQIYNRFHFFNDGPSSGELLQTKCWQKGYQTNVNMLTTFTCGQARYNMLIGITADKRQYVSVVGTVPNRKR